jgi:hypothetical protein
MRKIIRHPTVEHHTLLVLFYTALALLLTLFCARAVGGVPL